MKTVEILEAFTGYPDGPEPRAFVAGEVLSIPDDVSADFAKLIVDKKHASWGKTAAKQEKVS